ncbi:hypothetical protein [Floridanema evergladense]|uniref:Uncharacterized protein n=1 Tax=Floridaenema evergladense BLCC-F167 TaxID=3153639 RepID=A0ABV4WEV9_9CYAN
MEFIFLRILADNLSSFLSLRPLRPSRFKKMNYRYTVVIQG